MDWQGPNMDELWEDYVRSGRETEALKRLWLEEEIYAKVRELRRGHDFMTHIDIRVLVPICDACTHFEYRGYEEPKPLPDVFGSFWLDGYRTLGMSRKQITSVARALKMATGSRGVRDAGPKLISHMTKASILSMWHCPNTSTYM